MNTILSSKNKFNRVFENILSIVAILAIALANTGFTAQAAQRSLPGDWDGSAVQKTSVLLESDGFKMWYDGINFQGQTQVGLATSTDGTSWTKYFDNPVLSGDPDAWDSSGEHAPYVMKVGDQYKMWYEGSDGNVRQLGYATSDDGVTWTKFEGNPVLENGDGYDQDVAGHGSVLYEDGIYKLWYHAMGNQVATIAYATSLDGIHWTKYEYNPVLQPEGWENALWGPSVLKVGDDYYMWYSAFSSSYPVSIGAATSSDGVVWTRVGDAPIIMMADNYIGDPHVILDGEIFKMWFTNFSDGAVYYAESSNGIDWNEPVPVLTPGVLFPLEGWHDGNEGEVDANSCSAFGWSADPDNRDRDVQIRILSDGLEVATTTASDYGEDMDELGICPGGTCRFTVNLMGLISLGQEHQITVQAYDMETDDWWNLEGTPKMLTCPNPWFTAFPEQDVIEGWDWPFGAELHMSIDDPRTEVSPDYEESEIVGYAPWGSGQLWVWFDFAGKYDMKAGDIVTLTYGESVRIHTVRNLSVTKVDQVDDTVKGIADVGTEVHVWPYATGQERLAMAKTNGNAAGKWNADFSGIFDLAPGECGRSEVFDETGNRTAVDWCVPNTRFTVWPEWNYLEGYEWPDKAEVSISVAGKDACTTEATPGIPEWDPWNTFFSVNFPEGCTLEAGDFVTLNSETFSFTHQIQELTITEVNIDNDTVTGTAVFDPEQYSLHTWIHEVDGSYMQMTAEGGTWLADFGSQGFDLQPGMGGRVELVDQASNATAVDWHIPLPSFAAYMPSAIEGYDWPMGHEISLTINDEGYPVHAYSEQRPGFPEGETRVLFEIWQHDVSLEINDHVVMTDLATGFSKELWVADLRVTAFNLIDKTVSGIYDPDRSFWTQLDGQDPLDIVFDDNTWTATFTDMSPGTWGYVAQDDADHDGTVWDYQVPEVQGGNFSVSWSQTNPEGVNYLGWKGSTNLAGSCMPPNCPDNFEFFGNSWVSENENTPEFFFASLVGWGTTGTWSQVGPIVDINSVCLGCWNSADTPIHTTYQFFDDELRANLIVVQRQFDFGDTAYTHDVRPFIPRLYPWDGFSQVLHPNETGDALVVEIWPEICDFGCVAQSWDGSWFAIHNPDTGAGMIVQSTSSPISLWLDNDAGSFTNSSSILLLQPDGGFIGTVTETEYLCFYDSSIWIPSLTLPEGCQP